MARVVVTGLGLVTPAGSSVKRSWERLLSGKSCAAPITHFDASDMRTTFACEVNDFEPLDYFDKRQLKRIDRFLQFAIAAGTDALVDAGYTDAKAPAAEANDWAVYFGSGMGGLRTIEQTYARYLEKGARHGISPYFVPDTIINMAAGELSIRTGAKGPNLSHVSACATGAHAVGEASRLIERGDAQLVVAGGSDADVTPLGIGGFGSMRALSNRNDSPETASRPFDRDRNGFVMGEGAGALVLESLEHARARGATIYCEVAGYGATSDAHHMTSPSPDGEGAARCMTRALNDAQLSPEAVDYINAHGTSTPANDKFETIAIRRALGAAADQVAVSSTKSVTGHLLGAAGAVEIALCALAIRHGEIPPTANYETPDPDCDLDIVPNEARKLDVNVAMSNSFGFGGTNATIVVKRYDG